MYFSSARSAASLTLMRISQQAIAIEYKGIKQPRLHVFAQPHRTGHIYLQLGSILDNQEHLDLH